MKAEVIAASLLTPYQAGNIPQLCGTLKERLSKFLENNPNIEIVHTSMTSNFNGEEHPALIMVVFYKEI